jgi:hypothetical protein
MLLGNNDNKSEKKKNIVQSKNKSFGQKVKMKEMFFFQSPTYGRDFFAALVNLVP